MQEVDAYLHEELERAEAELEALRRQDEGVHTRIAQVDAIAVGLRHLIQRRGGGVRVASPRDEWGLMTRTGAVQRILRMAERPLSPRDIADLLAAKGRKDDNPNAVSGVLTRLRERGKVKPYGERGLWVWADGSAPAQDPLDGRGQGKVLVTR